MKCNEQKPICSGCLKGSRQCIYPVPPQRENRSSARRIIEKTQNWRHSDGFESALNFDVFSIDDRSQKVIVKFSDQGSSVTPSSIEPFQFNRQMRINSLRAPADIAESVCSSSNSFITAFISRVSPSPVRRELVQSSTHKHSPRPIPIPAVPNSTQDPRIQFFLRFHRENINEFHYFCYHDYRKFCTTTLMAMIQQSDALCNAVVAFSALIYSVKIDRSSRVQAFSHYALALQQLRVLVDQITINVDECHIALATALQLACFDVFPISMTLLIHSVSSTIQ